MDLFSNSTPMITTMANNVNQPLLVEAHVSYFFENALKQTRNFQNKYLSLILNIVLTIIFLAIVGGLLYYKYVQRQTQNSPEYIAYKNKTATEYITQSIINYQKEKEKYHQNLITGQPLWKNEVEIY